MIDIPNWLRSKLNDYRCFHCQEKMKEEGVVGIGIKISSKDEEKTVFSFIYLCKKCNNRTNVEFNESMTLEEFVVGMIDEYTQDNELEKKKIKENIPNKKKIKQEKESKISEEECNLMKKAIDGYEYWEDMLLDMGFSKEELEENRLEAQREYNERKK